MRKACPRARARAREREREMHKVSVARAVNEDVFLRRGIHLVVITLFALQVNDFVHVPHLSSQNHL